MPLFLPYLAKAYAELGQFDNAWRCIDEAITATGTTKERWHEADIYRIAGEIALLSTDPDFVKAEAYFERALVIAGAQQAKSWELRAAMSLTRLRGERNCLSRIYSWFTEGFDTLDLIQARALLDAPASEVANMPGPFPGLFRPSPALAAGPDGREEPTLGIDPDRD
jgi:predicted ATPase